MPITHIPSLPSTSDYLRHLADSAATLEPYDAVRADFQTRGRGQVGNSWESEEGRNLLISVYARPQAVDVARQFVVSMAVSIAVAETVAQLLPPDVRPQVKVKWPNDVYVADRKICGILVENRLAGRMIADTIIGVGLNVNQEVFTSPAPNPVSIKNISGQENDIAQVADALISALRLRLALVDDCDDAEVLRLYWSLLYRADGSYHNFADAQGPFSAKILSVMPDGHLVLLTQAGERRTYTFKEVEHVIALPGGGSVTPNLE